MSPFELREGVRRHFSNTFGADVSLARLLRIDRRLFDQRLHE